MREFSQKKKREFTFDYFFFDHIHSTIGEHTVKIKYQMTPN